MLKNEITVKPSNILGKEKLNTAKPNGQRN